MLWTWLARIDKRLWLALLISVVLHCLLVGGSENWLPDLLPDDEPLQVTLAAPPPPVAQPPKPIPPITPPRPQRKPARIPEQAPPPPADIASAPQPEAALPPMQTAAEQAPDTAPAPPVVQAESTPPPAEPIPPPQPVADPEPPPPPTPKHIEIEFAIDYDGASAVEKQSYQVSDDGHYVLSSTIQAKGLASLVLSELTQKSTGRVTAQGLQPESFTYQYGKNSKKAQKASFDWPGKTLMMEAGDSKQSAALENGTQDLLSFLYQFMFTPPLSQIQLIITNGKQLKTYHYQFEGEEQIKTNVGTLQTWHISKSGSKGDEKTDIWLAENYHYLPVRIRKTNSDGKVIQNNINAIKIDGAS